MRLLLIRTIAVFSVIFTVGNNAYANHYGDSVSCTVDPLISQLDSMSYNLFTRDKFFANDDELLASINMPPELLPRYTEAQIKERMKLISAEVPLVYNSQVKPFIDLFAYKRRGLMARCLANGQMYFPIFEAVLDRKGLPMELKYLPIVESALNPVAVSKAGATGLWQMMHGTGQMMGLEINTYTDDRRDPVKSTEAATEYLKKLYDIYHDWHLVLAAYNSGPGNVNKAIARAGGTKNFWAILNYLPAETRGYVPIYIAAVYVMEYHKDYKLVSAEPRRELYLIDTVMITSKVSLKHISNVLGIGEDELQFLNPSIKKGIVPYTQHGFPLNLPVNYFALFEARKEEVMMDSTMVELNTDAIMASTPKLLYHKVKKGESLSAIAAKYKVSVSNMKSWNRLKNSYVYPGQKLVIHCKPALPETSPSYAQVFAIKPLPKPDTAAVVAETPDVASADTTLAPDSAVSVETAHGTAIATTQASQPTIETSPNKFLDKNCNCIYHVVQPGDTLWNIAQRYNGVSLEKLKADNRELSGRPIKVGDKVKIKM